jgi:hypothetical protein
MRVVVKAGAWKKSSGLIGGPKDLRPSSTRRPVAKPSFPLIALFPEIGEKC